jgi:hypothetical protein
MISSPKKVYEHRVDPFSSELGYKIRGRPSFIGTGTFPSSPTVIVEQLMISVSFIPASYPVLDRSRVYSSPSAPLLERIVMV